eukprot:6187931-Pleurochrysis_carterae.AAC.2
MQERDRACTATPCQAARRAKAVQCTESGVRRCRADKRVQPDMGAVKNVCVVGAGHVGAPHAAVLAQKCPDIKVTVCDHDERKVAQCVSSPYFCATRSLLLCLFAYMSARFECRLHAKLRHSSYLYQCFCLPRRWNSSLLPFYEPSMQEVIEDVRGVNLFFSTDFASAIKAADMIMVSVSTPLKTEGTGAG